MIIAVKYKKLLKQTIKCYSGEDIFQGNIFFSLEFEILTLQILHVSFHRSTNA